MRKRRYKMYGPPSARTRKAASKLGRVGASAGLFVVFLGGSVLAFVLYANLPAGRRLVASGLQQLLASTLEGRFNVDAVDRVSLAELRARGISVHDPDGHLVLTVSELTVKMDVPSLVRKVLFGSGTVTLPFGHARIERAEVYLLPGRHDNVPTIVDAFTPSPSLPGTTPSTSSFSVKVWFPEIEVGHIYGRMALDGVPTLETELTSVRGSVVGSSELTTVDVDRFAAVIRGLGGADARGVGSVHVRAPGAVWTSFDGYFGDVQMGTVVRVDSPKLDVTLDVPRAEPSAVRALWAGYPLLQDLSAHVEAVGTLQTLQTQAKLTVGSGSITSNGELRLTGHRGADLDIDGRNLDLRALWPTVPRTDLDADTTLSVFQSGNVWAADVKGSTRATRVANTDVPPIDVTGSYNDTGFVGHALLHEPGVPLQATFDVHPDGLIELGAEAKRVDLSRAPRLQPYFSGRGLLDLQVKARIEKNRVVGQISGALNSFEYGEFSVKSNQFSGRASGPLDAPERIAVDLSINSQRLRAGAFGFDELKTKLRGTLTRPVVSTTINNKRGPQITAQATVIPQGRTHIDDLNLEIRRDEAVLNAKVAHVDLDGDTVRVDGLSMDGAGGKLTGSGQLGMQRVSLAAHGAGLDLAVIAHALGLPKGLIGGKLALDADVESNGKTQRGTLELQLTDGQAEGVAIDSLSLSGQLEGPQLDLQSTAKLRDFGSFSGGAQATLRGSLADPKTFETATGVLTVKAEHVPFGLFSYVIPKSAGVSEVRGEGNAILVLDRSDPKAIPNVSLVAGTTGLYVAMAGKDKDTPGTVIQGIDTQAGLSVNGTTGESDLIVKLQDGQGALLSVSTHTTVDLAQALREPNGLIQQLRATPLVAKAVLEERALSELPGPLAVQGLSGRLRGELSLRGTVNQPVLSAKTEISRLRFGESERDKAIDVCAQVDYEKSKGLFGALGELFTPTDQSRACKGARVAQFSANGRADWQKLTSTVPSTTPAWTGTAGLSLEGIPIDVIPVLAESGFQGRAFGAVMFDRRDAVPVIRSYLQVKDAVVSRARLGTAELNGTADATSLTATVKITQRDGTLTGNLRSALDWQGVVPGIDENQPITAELKGKNVDAVILTPFVLDVLSEVGGKLDADLKATLTPNPEPKAEPHWTGAINGTLAMHEGTLQLARLALRMKNVKLKARAEAHDNATLITIDSLSAAAHADKPNIAARGNLWLSGFQVSKGNANATVQGVPLLVEGVTLATLTGKSIAIDLERRSKDMYVELVIPELDAQLPQEVGRDLITLDDNESVVIAQPITEPQQSADEASLPWRMKFNLGNKVKVTRSDLFLPLSGKPEILLGDEFQMDGNVELRAGGRLSLLGMPRVFTIETGTVSFDAAGDPGDPRVRVTAICQLPQLTVRATVTGTFRKAKVTFESNDPTVSSQEAILGALLSAPTDNKQAGGAGLGAGAGYLGKALLANTALSNLELKAGTETRADQKSYQTYSAAYPITDELWFEGSYKTLQAQDFSGANRTAFSGTFDWRFRRNWSLRTEVGNIGAGVDLLWQYRY